MNFSRHKKLFILGLLLALTVAVPLTIYIIQQQTDNRSKAGASTVLSFSPTSTSTSPIQKNLNESIPLSISINPGSNLVSLVTLELLYDATKFEVSPANGFSPNTQTMPIILEGPDYTPGRFRVSLSIGSDPTKALSSPTTIGTVTLKAIGGTTSPGQISFGPSTQVLSLATADGAGENVLSSSTPAFIQVTSPVTPTTAISPTRAPTPSPSPSPTLTPSPTTAPTIVISSPTPILRRTISLTVNIHGIGYVGDNSNPTNHTTSNKNPLTVERPITLEIFNLNNQLVRRYENFIYWHGRVYGNNIDVTSDIPDGSYYLKVSTPGTLRKLLPEIFSLKLGTSSTPLIATLVTGDVDNSNSLTILDYNILLSCGYGELDPLPMSDPNSAFHKPSCQAHPNAEQADVNDDGIINMTDFNLLVREIAVQNGD